MSQFDPPVNDFETSPAEGKQSNPAGIVGFILSLLCLTAPIGLLVSLFALTKRPKGFAIAGVIIGLIFSALIAVAVILGIRMGPEFKRVMEGQRDYVQIKSSVAIYQQTNSGQTPPDLTALSLPADTLTDPWGTPWVYERATDGTSYALLTAGPDGLMDTADDARLEQSMQDEEVYSVLGEAIGEYYKNKKKMTP